MIIYCMFSFAIYAKYLNVSKYLLVEVIMRLTSCRVYVYTDMNRM